MIASRNAISVSITAGPQIKEVDGKRGKYTMYTVYVKNNHTGEKYVVKRRYSDFYKLRRELVEFVSWGHCSDCHIYAECISSYPFPRRRVFRSNQAGVVQERVDSLEMFMRYMLHCVTSGTFSNCAQADQNIRNCILKSFLQIEGSDFIRDIPAIAPAENVAASTSNPSTAVLPTPSGADSAGTNGDVFRENVNADTCHLCLQNWTDCYCSDDMDTIQRFNLPRDNATTTAVAAPPAATSASKDDLDTDSGQVLQAHGDSRFPH